MLIGKLNDTTRTAATRAASICMGMGHHEVDLEHLFLALLEQEQSDFTLIARQHDVSLTMLEQDLRSELQSFHAGNTRTPVFSQHLPKLFENAWLIASLEGSGGQKIRSAHLLLAMLTEPELSQLAARASSLYSRFNLDDIKHNLAKLTKNSDETVVSEQGAEGDDLLEVSDPVTELGNKQASKTPALDQFTTNLTESAKNGKVEELP